MLSKRMRQAEMSAKRNDSASPTLSAAQARLRKDLESLDAISSTVRLSPADPYQVEVTVKPPVGIWAGGTFHFRLLFTENFPCDGPKVRYKGPRRVFHPNIEGEEGRSDWGVCLGLQTDWLPTYTVRDLVFGLECLFQDPSYDNPLPGVAKEAAQMLKDTPDEFKRKAQSWMR